MIWYAIVMIYTINGKVSWYVLIEEINGDDCVCQLLLIILAVLVHDHLTTLLWKWQDSTSQQKHVAEDAAPPHGGEEAKEGNVGPYIPFQGSPPGT